MNDKYFLVVSGVFGVERYDGFTKYEIIDAFHKVGLIIDKAADVDDFLGACSDVDAYSALYFEATADELGRIASEYRVFVTQILP